MLRITPMSSKKYLTEGLSNSDYYRENKIVNETFKGNLAKQLGLENMTIDQSNFESLYDNINPLTGDKITIRNREDRKPYYDFTFSAPKSVSILWSLTDNLELHNSITKAWNISTLKAMEFAQKKFTLTRDQRNNRNTYNQTNSLLYVDFLHDTTRPIKGIPDMHLHTHFAVFNMTYDQMTDTFKSVEFHDLAKYRNQIEAVHHSILAKELKTIGIEVRNTNKSFEVKGFDRNMIDKFSNRTLLIEEYAKLKQINDIEQKAELGAKLREKKTDKIPKNTVLKLWKKRLNKDQTLTLHNLSDPITLISNAKQYQIEQTRVEIGDSKESLEAKSEEVNRALELSINHNFERLTLFDSNNLLTYALNTNLSNLSIEELEQQVNLKQLTKELIPIQIKRTKNFTLPAIIKQEEKIIELVNTSINNYPAIGLEKNLNVNLNLNLNASSNNKITINPNLTSDQEIALKGILNSSNRIDYIKGDAGAGKTYLIQNIKEIVEPKGLNLFAYAPTTTAGKIVLREEVTSNADTIQKLLIDPNEQAKLNHKSIVFIDEAGMLSYSDMIQILSIQNQKQFKLILVGDTKQHSSVVRGDALRLIEEKTELKPLTLTTNRRQINNQTYMKAINHLAKNNIKESITEFDKIGAIVEESNSTKRYNLIADEYVKYLLSSKEVDNLDLARVKGRDVDKMKVNTLNTLNTKDVLVVTPTNYESDIVTARIRKRLIKEGILDKESLKVKTLVDRNLTTSEKQNKLLYQKGDYLIANQNTKNLKKGQEYKVTFDKDYNPVIEVERKSKESKISKELPSSNKTIKLEVPYQNAKDFTVHTTKELELSKNDVIKITANNKSLSGVTLLKNGRYQVKTITEDVLTKKPVITLDNNQILDSNFKHLKHGYTSTSYSSQGLTVKHLIVAQSEVSIPATSYQQGYVSLSRGKTSVSLYTDNKAKFVKSLENNKTRPIVHQLGGVGG